MEDLVTHAVKDHPLKNNSTNKHDCSVCGEDFNNLDLFISRILRVHNLVDDVTLKTTEAGQQLVNVWPSETSKGFKCYDCGKDVGEKANLIGHKRSAHYKQKDVEISTITTTAGSAPGTVCSGTDQRRECGSMLVSSSSSSSRGI